MLKSDITGSTEEVDERVIILRDTFWGPAYGQVLVNPGLWIDLFKLQSIVLTAELEINLFGLIREFYLYISGLICQTFLGGFSLVYNESRIIIPVSVIRILTFNIGFLNKKNLGKIHNHKVG